MERPETPAPDFSDVPADQLARRLADARRFAVEAGQITLEYFGRSDLVVDRKADDSPVTAADRQAEAHLRRQIAQAWPEDAVFGEEMAEQPGKSPFRWIIDPIDGTKSFIHGVPLYGTLVALEREGEPLLGVIHIPALGETVYAARGQGAWYQQAGQPPKPARVSACRSLAEALFLTSEVANFEQIGRRDVFELWLLDGGHRSGRADGRSDRLSLGPGRPDAGH